MPQGWRHYWPVPGFEHLEDGEVDVDQLVAEAVRDGAINKLGNLTLVTSPLNSAMSNGPFSSKLPALRAHASLALNRDASLRYTGIDSHEGLTRIGGYNTVIAKEV